MRLLTDVEVDLIKDDDAEWSAGCELLDLNLRFVEDISDDLLGGSTSYKLNAEIHTTLSLSLMRELQWGIDHVRPYTELSRTGLRVRFYRGVYVLVTPRRKIGVTPATYEIEGYDRLYLLLRQVGADYEVLPGTTYRTALLAVFAAAGLTGVLIEGSSADSTVPLRADGRGHFWPLIPDDQTDPDQTDTPVTWLRIINDLLRAIRFRAVWCDELGQFRCEEYRSPAERPSTFIFDADEPETPVGEEREVFEDPWKLPTRWVFRWRNAPDGTSAADRRYQYDMPDGDPMSAAARGLVWTSVVDFDAASRDKLVQLGNDRVAADRAMRARYEVTAAFPAQGHADIYTYRDVAAGVDRKVQLVEAEVDLLGEPRSMTLEGVT